MERINEIIATLSDEAQVVALSDDDLTALRDELRTLGLSVIAGEVEGVEDAVATASQIGDFYEGVQYVLGSRAEAAAAQAEALAAVAERLSETPEPDPEPEPEEPEGGAPVVSEVTAPVTPVAEDPNAPVTPAPVLEPVGAAVTPAAPVAPAPALPALSTITPPAANAPTALAHTEPRVMNLRTNEYNSLDELVSTFIREHESFLSMTGDSSQKVPLGRINFDIPEERTISGVDEQTANGRLARLLDGAQDPSNWTPALVASGGFCAPGEPDYSIPQISGMHRPLADALPTVRAARGRKIVVTPPALSGVATTTGTTAGSAVSIWTNANDLAPGSKPVQVVPCPTSQTISTQAIVERLQFGNMESQAFPELVSAWLGNTAAAWARAAESQLLGQIAGFSLSQTTGQILGATNDFKGWLHQAAAAIRSRQRVLRNARLRVLIPSWFIDFVAADLAHNHAGDGLERFTQDPETFVRALFNAAGCNVTFYEDSAAGGTNQIFSTPTGGADLVNFPPGPASTSARIVWYIFPEGTFARADAGTLDLGIVRDSTLNNTNDYQIFSESWEAIVPHVIESLVITSTLCTTGAGALDVTAAAYCTAS